MKYDSVDANQSISVKAHLVAVATLLLAAVGGSERKASVAPGEQNHETDRC
jgi:hypothetical protein